MEMQIWKWIFLHFAVQSPISHWNICKFQEGTFRDFLKSKGNGQRRNFYESEPGSLDQHWKYWISGSRGEANHPTERTLSFIETEKCLALRKEFVKCYGDVFDMKLCDNYCWTKKHVSSDKYQIHKCFTYFHRFSLVTCFGTVPRINNDDSYIQHCDDDRPICCQYFEISRLTRFLESSFV